MRYFVTLSDRDDGIMEIISERELKNIRGLGKTPTVLGSGRNQKKAFDLVRDLIDRIYSETGDIDVDTYFSS